MTNTTKVVPTEPTVVRATVRDGFDKLYIECRMSDGQKGAFVTVDSEFPELAERIATMLAAAPSAQAGETNAAGRASVGADGNSSALTTESPAPAAPTLPTVDELEKIHANIKRRLELEPSAINHTLISNKNADKLCNAARIGLQCATAEPVAWMPRKDYPQSPVSAAAKAAMYEHHRGHLTVPLIVQPEAR